MNSANNLMCYAQGMVKDAKARIAEASGRIEVLGAADLLARELVQVLAESQDCKTLREMREQVAESMEDVRQDHDVARVLNTLRELGMDAAARELNCMLTSIACIMECKRKAEMAEHFQYFAHAKAKLFHILRWRTNESTTRCVVAHETLERWAVVVKDSATHRLPAVAISKAGRKHAIAQHNAAWTDHSTGKSCYWQPLQTSRYPFRTWCQALVIQRISKGWFVGSI